MQSPTLSKRHTRFPLSLHICAPQRSLSLSPCRFFLLRVSAASRVIKFPPQVVTKSYFSAPAAGAAQRSLVLSSPPTYIY